MSEREIRRIAHRFLQYLYDVDWTRIRVRVEWERDPDRAETTWIATFREMMDDRLQGREAGLLFRSPAAIRDYSHDEMLAWAHRAAMARRPADRPMFQAEVALLNPDVPH